METTTINQIIESATILITPIITLFLAYALSKKLLGFKKELKRESSLLKDLIFYKTVIELYKERILEYEDSTQYNTFRAQAMKMTEIEPSKYSKPSRIKKRLNYLHDMNEKVKQSLQKIDKKI